MPAKEHLGERGRGSADCPLSRTKARTRTHAMYCWFLSQTQSIGRDFRPCLHRSVQASRLSNSNRLANEAEQSEEKGALRVRSYRKVADPGRIREGLADGV